MDIGGRVSVIKGFAQEIVTEQELRNLFETNNHPLAYDGFEPSGLAPIHFGLLRARNVNKMLKAGVRFTLYLADYFAFINNKLGGDLERIRKAGEYFVEVWKACGIDINKVKIIWAKDLMDDIKYWDRFMRVGKVISIDRAKRAITIMGRKEGEKISTAQLFYPAMQVTDIFELDLDACEMGIDQRRANILAREIADKYKWKKLVAIHHPLMLGLQGMPKGVNIKGDPDTALNYKMSKSDPKSALYMHDSYATIKEKINGAYCPERVVEGNPLLNFLELALLEGPDERVVIERPQKFGGDLELDGYGELISAYQSGKLHPIDLKAFVIERLESAIKPVREHFEKDRRARELYELVKGYQVTR